MVFWQTELQVSWRAQWMSLLLHGVLVMVIVFLPWPLSYMPVCLVLLVLVVFGCIRSQRCINACHGEIRLLDNECIDWQGKQWKLVGRPWMLQGIIILVLHHAKSANRQRLWLMSDSMDEKHWRNLRNLLLHMSSVRHLND